jgi:dihydrofolate reductase
MGKVVVTEFVSIDGVIEDPGGAEDFEHGGWSFEFDRGEEGEKFKVDETMQAEVQLLGRVTYEGFAKAWPSMKDDVGFAEKFNSMPKYVVSTTLQDADWNNSTILRSLDEVSKLKDDVDGDILVAGSATLVQSLAKAGLVDEYRLMVFPTMLGSGKRLFDGDLDRSDLKLTDSKVLDSGILILTYEQAR